MAKLAARLRSVCSLTFGIATNAATVEPTNLREVKSEAHKPGEAPTLDRAFHLAAPLRSDLKAFGSHARTPRRMVTGWRCSRGSRASAACCSAYSCTTCSI